MNCIETKKNIEALLDGELENAQKGAVENHLWICPNCRDSREQMLSLSSLLQVNRISPPSMELDKRLMNSFRNHHESSKSRWHRLIFGAFVIPKPALAGLLILALAGFWLAFQIGKINSSAVSINPPPVFENPMQSPSETKVQTVVVEVPVIREKIITRTVFVREQKINKSEKIKPSTDVKQNNLPLFSSTVAQNGYFTDVSLEGFEPSAEISAKIIKEVKEDEK